MRKFWWLILLVPIVFVSHYFLPEDWHNPFVGLIEIKELPLVKYDIDSLRESGGVASEIKISGIAEGVEERKKEVTKFKTQVFTFESGGKKISGTVNIPNLEQSSLKKAIIMVRGFAESEGYYPGSGTWKVADALANEGYATFSIDFLGFGESDNESKDVLEARFVKVENVMDLLESVKNLPWIDKEKIGIWAHSNGGQIVLSALETTGENYPTVLWAPMTNPFPKSVLETIEEDSPLRQIIKDFEKKYDPRRYAFENYYDWINSPILIQQGTEDEWCQVEWQTKVVESLKEMGKEAELVVYPNNDHNLSKSWDEAVKRDIRFFEENIK
ncbi:prolyl oligopeptidase family serine peptidase [Patescibacteria group bacterium]|nr:prolyl oligopeptidase family serine peptidase [Patescibacteria group bacterium]